MIVDESFKNGNKKNFFSCFFEINEDRSNNK